MCLDSDLPDVYVGDHDVVDGSDGTSAQRLRHHRPPRASLDHPVPAWMRDFVLIYIARALGMCDTARTYQEAKNNVLLTLTDSRGCVLTLTDQRKLALTRTDPRKLAPTRAPEA